MNKLKVSMKKIGKYIRELSIKETISKLEEVKFINR